MKARLLNSDGSDIVIEPENKITFTLSELYKILDCDMVQVVILPASGKCMIMDEDAKLKPNPILNIKATLLWGDDVVNKVVICDRSMFR